MGLIACCGLAGRDYSIGHTSIVMYDAERGNREIRATVFYPSDADGYNAPLALSSAGKFPVICFAHGYLLPTDTYENIWEALVPRGYLIIFPETESGLFPSHDDLADDLGFALSEITRYGLNEASMFFNRIDTMQCVMGHSMGGGAALTAASKFPDIIKGVVVLAPYNTKPSAIQAVTAMALPTLIISGSNDCITPFAEHPLPMYYGSVSPHKTLINIIGGSHCQMGGSNTLCRFGEIMSGCKADISQTEQHKLLAKYITPWLQFFMKSDRNAGRLFDSILTSDTSVEFLRSRSLSDENFRK
jgi:dienelactone hydrolase